MDTTADRNIDCLIAQHVFGHVVGYMSEQDVTPCVIVDQATATFDALPEYSTDIATAWEVVARLVASHPIFDIAYMDIGESEYAKKWSCNVAGFGAVVADTAARCICLAALATKGIVP